MRVFKDRNGREWQLDANVSSLQRVKDICKIDLFEIENIEESLVMQIFKDPLQLGHVLYAMCLPQIHKAEMTKEDFGEQLTGDVLKNARDALVVELPDFFVDKEQREIIKQLFQKIITVNSEANKMIKVAVENYGVQESTQPQSSGDAQESSE